MILWCPKCQGNVETEKTLAPFNKSEPPFMANYVCPKCRVVVAREDALETWMDEEHKKWIKKRINELLEEK